MRGRVEDGALVTVEPTLEHVLEPGTVVLCTCHGQYLHLIKAVRGDQYQIGNNHGKINGWVTRRHIHGVLILVEP